MLLRRSPKEVRMHIREIFERHTVACSFEFFPPKTDESARELYEFG